MCSILVFAKPDNDHPDPSLDWQKFKRGDVIDVHENDDFFWGSDIQGPKALGWWRVIVLPGVSASEMIGLTSSEILDRPDTSAAPRKLRINFLNLDQIEAVSAKKKALAKGEAITHSKQAIFDNTSMKPATVADGFAKVKSGN